MPLENHPLRELLSNELHARPFPVADGPCQVAYLALSVEPETDLDSANRLFEALGGTPLGSASAHSYQHFDGFSVRWEQHTEFVTFAVFLDGESKSPFDDSAFDIFPKAWLKSLPNKVLTSAKVRMLGALSQKEAEKRMVSRFYSNFQSESLAISYVLDQNAVIASDFRMDADGHVRFGVIPIGQVGRHRLGRIIQRLLEVETYRAVAMLTLPIAREVFDSLASMDIDLTRSVEDISAKEASNASTLDRLMSISARIEHLNASHSYRFGAGKAYSALVDQRITVLREERFLGRQTFAEFMMRRFHPTVRTCKAAEQRLQGDFSAGGSGGRFAWNTGKCTNNRAEP